VLLPTPRRRRVLLLEDNDAVAASLRRMLETYGHDVTRFARLDQARAAIPPVGFDVLLCDYDLPDGTGLDFLAEVEDSSPLGLVKWTSILCSGERRDAEVAASGLAVDHVLLKGAGTAQALIEIVGA
jgi:CheY-like chemotaxis protein